MYMHIQVHRSITLASFRCQLHSFLHPHHHLVFTILFQVSRHMQHMSRWGEKLRPRPMIARNKVLETFFSSSSSCD